MYSAFAAWGTQNSRRAASPLVRWVEEEERQETPRDFSLKIGAEPSQIELHDAKANDLCKNLASKDLDLRQAGGMSKNNMRKCAFKAIVRHIEYCHARYLITLWL
ncbi:hypothetical protein TNCV_1749651 [Trichonephila clavipes]|nr:hypothetical protein TNCV_1749651 [Trichonephila clavipes]